MPTLLLVYHPSPHTHLHSYPPHYLLPPHLPSCPPPSLFPHIFLSTCMPTLFLATITSLPSPPTFLPSYSYFSLPIFMRTLLLATIPPSLSHLHSYHLPSQLHVYPPTCYHPSLPSSLLPSFTTYILSCPSLPFKLHPTILPPPPPLPSILSYNPTTLSFPPSSRPLYPPYLKFCLPPIPTIPCSTF